MHIVTVLIKVNEEYLDAFREATIENARNSIQEPGIVRFDFLQQRDDPTRFVLLEVYKTPDDQLKHRETSHYQIWKDRVTEMMAEPRVGIKYTNIFPVDQEWS